MMHLTVADKPHEGLQLLFYSKRANFETRVLGYGSTQKIGHAGAGFGLKLSCLKEELQELDPNQPIVFTDAFDVLFQNDYSFLEKKILELGDKVLFASEATNWPDKTLVYPPTQKKYKYLNSGVFCGRAGSILKLLQEPFDAKTDDQFYYAKQFASGKSNIVLDYDQEIFACLQGISKNQLEWTGHSWKVHDAHPLLLHLNSGGTRTRLFVHIVRKLLPGCEKLARAAAWRGMLWVPWYKHRFLIAYCLVLLAIYLLKSIHFSYSSS